MDELSNLRSQTSLRARLAGRSSFPNVRRHNKQSGHRPDFSATSFDAYFDSCEHVSVSVNVFRVYISNSCTLGDSPTLVLLHGGGYSALTWALFARAIRRLCECRIIAIDLRGHGGTKTNDDYDLSMHTLCSDISSVLKTLCKDYIDHAPLVFIGHSMGGALAVNCAHKLQHTFSNFSGLVVIDVVEGTALEALKNMKYVLRSRPKSFNNLQSAVQWCYSSGMTRNLEAAKVSMPGQLKNAETNETATNDLNKVVQCEGEESESTKWVAASQQIAEENEESENSEDVAVESCKPSPDSQYTWRIDLEKTETHWSEWFQGLSELFLSAPTPSKLLILAGVDRLDRPLTIGQMQGKFQTEVLTRCGHAAHEDDPDKVAEIIEHFLRRNKILRQ